MEGDAPEFLLITFHATKARPASPAIQTHDGTPGLLASARRDSTCIGATG
jgi:hypothetical protein